MYFCTRLNKKKYDFVMLVSLKVSASWRFCASLFDNGHPVISSGCPPSVNHFFHILVTTFFIIMVL